MLVSISKKINFSVCIILILFYFIPDLRAQWDESELRHLTRSKMWSSIRMSGLQGQQGFGARQTNSEAGLSYPGNSIRSGEWLTFWNSSENFVGNLIGRGTGPEVHSVARPDHSHGEGTYILVKADNTKIISHSGPRNTTPDVIPLWYDASAGPEYDLGVNDLKSTYWPGSGLPQPPQQPVEIHNFDYHKYIGRDNEAEEIIIVKWANKTGITTTKKLKAWSYQKYDDFFIVENIFEYTGDFNGDGDPDSVNLPVLNDVYFAFGNMFSSSHQGETWGKDPYYSWGDWRRNNPPAQDDHYKYSGSSGYEALIPEDTPDYIDKKMSYGYDGNYPLSDYDDTGNPYRDKYVQRNTGNEQQGQSENQLLSYGFVGMAPIDYDPSDGFTNDGDVYVAPASLDQPSRCKWWPLFALASIPLEPDASAFTDEEIYNMLTDEDEFGLIHDDPPRPNALSVTGTYVHYQVYGPYTLNPGDKVKIVMAYVGGSGADYLANQGVYDPRLAPENEWARSLDPQKFEQYKLGEQSLFFNLSLAQEIYDLGYDIPDPPPDVLIQDLYHNANGHLQIFWSDEASNAEDPDYSGEEAKDVAGYRIYRMKIGGAAEKADPDDPRHDDKLSADWHNGPYELMDSILVGETESSWRKIITWDPERKLYRCSDGETKVGAFDYFYSVRSFDTGHDDWNGTGMAIPSLESGFSAPEQRMNTGYQPGYIVNEETDNFEKQVRVVPNPYKRDGLHEYSNTIEIKFFNIPQKCVISIFSVSGDLVSREYHDQASPIGSWDQQTIKFAGDIAPGIYFWVVESKVEGEYEYVTTEGDTLPPVYVNSKGQIQKGTLLIIREQ